ncbi:hypothetical protein ACU4GD_32695 [Cupriavidus basilensis]
MRAVRGGFVPLLPVSSAGQDRLDPSTASQLIGQTQNVVNMNGNNRGLRR